jgi:hypothetical protein
MNSPFNSFSTNNSSSGNKSFMESNSLVSKFAFILLVIFAFIILLRIGISLMTYFLSPNQSPHLIDGMVDATNLIVYQQDQSGNPSTSTIYRSVNGTDGIEFTWSVWINITNLQYLEGQYRHVFFKGNSDLESNGLNFPNNCPGLYIAPNSNSLVVMMNTYNVINNEIIIPDIPLNKWVNVIIRCQNTTLDVYINGVITRSVELIGVPKQNYGNVYVAMNGGFEGYISNLWYYNYSLGTTAIQNLVANGPNTNMVGSNGIDSKDFDYLSLRWYFGGP